MRRRRPWPVRRSSGWTVRSWSAIRWARRWPSVRRPSSRPRQWPGRPVRAGLLGPRPAGFNGFRRCAGDEVADLADRSYAGGDVTDDEWARVFASFGPHVPDEQHRRAGPPTRSSAPTAGPDPGGGPPRPALHSQRPHPGGLAPATRSRLRDAAEEVVSALPPGRGHLQRLPGAGHFLWSNQPRRLRALLSQFTVDVSAP